MCETWKRLLASVCPSSHVGSKPADGRHDPQLCPEYINHKPSKNDLRDKQRWQTPKASPLYRCEHLRGRGGSGAPGTLPRAPLWEPASSLELAVASWSVFQRGAGAELQDKTQPKAWPDSCSLVQCLTRLNPHPNLWLISGVFSAVCC